jgi:hypothetical protein
MKSRSEPPLDATRRSLGHEAPLDRRVVSCPIGLDVERVTFLIFRRLPGARATFKSRYPRAGQQGL